jgi:enoyl-CoA hydratase/carnithine racemase
LRAAATAFARELAAAGPLAVPEIRASMRGDLASRVAAATAREHEVQARLRPTADFAEGVAAAAERRRPEFTGR